MHELSIVEALIEQVQREVRRSGQRGKILGIELNIGRLSGVSCDSVRFAFELLTPGSALDGVKIVIHQSKPFCNCQKCRVQTEIDGLVLTCPKCGSEEIVIEGGRDLLLQSIDMEEDEKVQSK